jgi:hypothetical protein
VPAPLSVGGPGLAGRRLGFDQAARDFGQLGHQGHARDRRDEPGLDSLEHHPGRRSQTGRVVQGVLRSRGRPDDGIYPRVPGHRNQRERSPAAREPLRVREVPSGHHRRYPERARRGKEGDPPGKRAGQGPGHAPALRGQSVHDRRPDEAEADRLRALLLDRARPRQERRQIRGAQELQEHVRRRLPDRQGCDEEHHRAGDQRAHRAGRTAVQGHARGLQPPDLDHAEGGGDQGRREIRRDVADHLPVDRAAGHARGDQRGIPAGQGRPFPGAGDDAEGLCPGLHRTERHSQLPAHRGPRVRRRKGHRSRTARCRSSLTAAGRSGSPGRPTPTGRGRSRCSRARARCPCRRT